MCAESRAARCARRSRSSAKRSPATSTLITRSGSGRSSPTSTSWTNRSTGSRTPSRNRSAPFAAAVELLCTTVGIQRRGAQCILAEIGADMTRFASPRPLASWAGQCPGNDQSAGKRRSGKTRDGSKWLDFALEEAAMAAIHVKANCPAAQYRRLKPRRGHKRALGAVKHTLICAIWHMLSTGETYRDLGPDYFTNRDPERQTKRLVKQLERLGHHVTLQEGAAAA